MDHLVKLTPDEELALADLALRAQDPRVTVETQLAAILHRALAPIVAPLIEKQAVLAKDVMAETDALARRDIYMALRLPTQLERIAALQAALAAFALRLEEAKSLEAKP